MRGLMRISAAILVFSAATSLGGTLAAEPSYAPGSRVGLVTLPGLSPAKSFSGFEDTEKRVRVVAVEMPEGTFSAIEASIGQKNQPPGMQKPERFETALGPAYLTRESAPLNGENVEQFAMIAKAGKVAALITVQIPASAASGYPADAVKRMLASLSLRSEVPVKEQLALLPFEMKDLGGFKTVRTLAVGQSVLLTDGDADTALENSTSMVIAVSRGGPAQAEDRSRFAQQLIEAVPGLKSGRVTSSEPMRVGGGQGFETRMDAVMAKGDIEVTLVQWLRFGSSGYIRMVGMAPKSDWSKVFPRLRTVRDNIELK